MNKDNELDDLFKRKLEDPVEPAAYQEQDWSALEQMLDKPKKKRVIVYWMPVLSGVAALLLLFFGWWMLRQQRTEQKSNQSSVANLVKERPKTNKAIAATPSQPRPAQLKKAPGIESFVAITTKGEKGGRKSISILPVKTMSGPTIVSADTSSNNSKVYPQPNKQAIAEKKSPALSKPQTNELTASNITVKTDTGTVSKPQNKPVKTQIKQSYRPQFALSVLAAPDLNGVGGFQQSKLGTNVGLLFSAGVSKKLTISTGAIYSVKPYLTGFGNYHTPYQFPVTPLNVVADCRMLDIPLNIGYQVYNKHQNQVSIGTGLSSYIMLHESYKFNYAGTYETGPSNYTVPGIHKYFFGVLNLNATYEHQVNSKFGISVQPYLKLPLGNLGYSQVHLQSTGVAIGVTWNLNPLQKP
ncbi:hypothetical protein [Mucilaginibacter gotjawali]|uniref:Uncharacterized protein n=2 Tax=Mucilaginibacter gotjawali TaxID=1550579 RepID=A0A839SDU9_9SPHI|nr:hypothetical protein [Mucilaginibacter gotjawali]MBB3056401.1 hypothetical protein [Mucilaginibacter gotjawali]BAU55108.1 hypothetical protein MgSA37_03289 [Mucilaginibacter gotjawali]